MLIDPINSMLCETCKGYRGNLWKNYWQIVFSYIRNFWGGFYELF